MTAVPEVIAAPVPAEARPDLLRRPRATSGVWSWFTTIDHKKIGILYGTTALVFFVIAGIEALLIRLQLAQGVALEEAIVHSAITRAQPILLTALAAMIGALFILDDPIFNGLAISLIFGILVSTLLTLVVIPTLYFVAYQGRFTPTTLKGNAS